MAENRHYVIEISATTKGGKGGNADNAIAGEQGTSNNQKIKENQSADDLETAKILGAGLIAYAQVKSFATQAINHEVSLVELRTGSSRLQERANLINTAIQQGVGIAESTIAGAMVGNVYGAIAGFALGTAHTIVGYAQNQQRLDVQKSVENESLEMQYIRAGAGGSRKS